VFRSTRWPPLAAGIYPERREPSVEPLDRFVVSATGLLASRFRPRPSRFNWIVDLVHKRSAEIKNATDDQIREASRLLRQRLRREEVAGRALGVRHFDVQLIGGLVLLQGMIAEMETGEGKTLTATLPACAAAFAGVPVHVITVNDYLATRDAQWMMPVYQSLGLSVGIIEHDMPQAARRAAYQCDVTYCTNKEVTFDYLRDRIILWDRPHEIRLQLERLYGERSRMSKVVLRGLHFAIVDEADSVLIDEARTPLIISAEDEACEEQNLYEQALHIAQRLKEKSDYLISPGERILELTDQGKDRIEDIIRWDGTAWINRQQREELVRQALVALNLFSRDKQYLVKEGRVQIIDEYTGRLMPDRSWERGLHQLIEIKENCEITSRKETKARISYQRFFRRYLHLAGMTGTAREVAGELWATYGLPVVSIPTNKPLRRKQFSDSVYSSAEQKWEAIICRLREEQYQGRPVLIGTRSVEASEHLSGLLSAAGLQHKVLNARQDKEEAETIAQAGERGRITVATNMAGRGTDIRLAPGIAELGGLHVIATERHEAGRIDRQLFGRCGRQGDPGTNEAIVSLDDELIVVYLDKVSQWLGKAVLRMPINHFGAWFEKMLLQRAQRKAQRLHARMRHDLLKLDEQVGDALAFSGKLE
jgi:preprotein translocase subunit SecA